MYIWVTPRKNTECTQLDLIETTSVDYEGMAKKLFQLIFAEALDEKPDKVCCTKSDGKELLDQNLLRCTIHCVFMLVLI